MNLTGAILSSRAVSTKAEMIVMTADDDRFTSQRTFPFDYANQIVGRDRIGFKDCGHSGVPAGQFL